MKTLETSLRHLRDSGRKALVPYFVAGLTPDWVRHVEAAILAGADAVEIGIPFSDPMMDGVVIQAAALRALNAGTTLDSLCTDLASLSATAPLVAMTYYNVFHHYGLERAAGKLQASGIAGAIVPDLSLEESDEWARACDDHDVTTIFLFAPVDRPGSGATTHRGDPGLRLRLGTNGRHRSGSRHRGCPTSRRDHPRLFGRSDVRRHWYRDTRDSPRGRRRERRRDRRFGARPDHPQRCWNQRDRIVHRFVSSRH